MGAQIIQAQGPFFKQKQHGKRVSGSDHHDVELLLGIERLGLDLHGLPERELKLGDIVELISLQDIGDMYFSA